MPNPLQQVISGGQIGADVAALRAAHACGIPTGGWMTKKFRTRLGPMSPEDVEKYGMIETSTIRYSTRTKKNVQAADGTIQFAYDWNSAGEKLTSRFVQEAGQTHFHVTLMLTPTGYVIADEKVRLLKVAEWIKQEKIEILNVAGNGNTEIEDCVEGFLGQVFHQLNQG